MSEVIWRTPTEETISRVACAIFRKQGYHATPMRTIAAALGLQPAALYYYYASKEELLFRIMDRAIDALDARVRERIDPGDPARQQLLQAVEAHITAVADHLDELSVFLHEWKALNPERQRHIAAKRDSYERIFRSILEAGAARGEFTAVDSKLASFLILAACNWLYNWYHPDGQYRPEEIARSFGDLMLHGLLRDETEAAG